MNPAHAYRQTYRLGLTTREVEALVLSQCAHDLEAAARRLPHETFDLMRAITANCQAWFTLMEGLASAPERFPAEQVRSLQQVAAFVQGRSRELIADPREEGVAALVAINRNLAAGLRGQAAD